MPWITYLAVVVKLFKVDPSKNKMPRDPYAVEKANPQQLLTMAQNRIHERVPLTRGLWDLWLLNSEALIKKIFTC